MLERDDIERIVGDYRGGGDDGSNGRSPVVPIAEPGQPRVAAAESYEGETGDD